MNKLPNLELLEYKAKQYFFNNEENKAQYKALIEQGQLRRDFIAEMFSQAWGSTCLGFDVDEKGQPMFGGSAMTEAYTTVFLEPLTETYLIFFGDRVCYQVKDANDTFLNDLKNHSLKALSLALKEY